MKLVFNCNIKSSTCLTSLMLIVSQVDQLIGQDHLFKRSIILIKAWCFYESRILGAHHGLISTYALQILVLNIINVFHSSLPDPLAVSTFHLSISFLHQQIHKLANFMLCLQVLYKFLDYYSAFDWDNYCVSINGPIPISSFPQTGEHLNVFDSILFVHLITWVSPFFFNRFNT